MRLLGQPEPGREGPLQRGVGLPLRLVRLRPFAGEQAQQVLEPVAGGPPRLGIGHFQQLRVDQLVDQFLRVPHIGVQYGRPRPGGEVRRAQQAEPAVHPGRLRRQVPVGEPEAGAHPALARAQHVEAGAVVAQPRHQAPYAQIGFGRQPRAGDPQREREAVAQGAELFHRDRVAAEPVGPGQFDQQRRRLGRLQHPQP